MSRTDVHRPPDVQLWDPYNRHLMYRYPRWPWEVVPTPWKNLFCGCRMCTGHHWYRWDRRRTRHQWKQVRRNLIKDLETWDNLSLGESKGSW